MYNLSYYAVYGREWSEGDFICVNNSILNGHKTFAIVVLHSIWGVRTPPHSQFDARTSPVKHFPCGLKATSQTIISIPVPAQSQERLMIYGDNNAIQSQGLSSFCWGWSLSIIYEAGTVPGTFLAGFPQSTISQHRLLYYWSYKLWSH